MILAAIGVAFLVGSLVLILVRRSQQGKLWQVVGTETSTARDLKDLAASVKRELEGLGQTGPFHQTAEVKGVIRSDSPLKSEIAGQPCVYYSTSVQREYEEPYQETDPQTKRTITKTRRGSEVVASNKQSVPFWVEDATGRLLVNPNGAKIDAIQTVDRFEPAPVGTSGMISVGGFSISVGGFSSGARTLGYRFRENVLPLDRQVYVLGEANDSSGDLTIQAPQEKGPKFIISLKSEEELVRSTRTAILWLLVSAAACGVVGVALIVAGLVR